MSKYAEHKNDIVKRHKPIPPVTEYDAISTFSQVGEFYHWDKFTPKKCLNPLRKRRK